MWVVVDILAQVNTPKLDVPNVFQEGLFTDANRTSFIINPFGNGLQGWAVAAAIIPALLATVLLFMDQQITALIVNRKDHKLKVSNWLAWHCSTLSHTREDLVHKSSVWTVHSLSVHAQFCWS